MLKAHDLWYGTQDSLHAVFIAAERLAVLEVQGEAAIKAKVAEMWAAKGGAVGEDPFAMPPLWQAKDGVAVIDISGPLIQGHAGFMRFFGLTGYGDISQAVTEAVASKDVKSIMLAVNSSGGSVNGVEDAGNVIRSAATHKPVIAYTDGNMASAAYWLGSSADAVYASKLAEVGSVGTILVHTEYSKMMEQDGVKKTLITHGEHKGDGNPYEPLSASAKEQLQGMVDEAGEIFVDYVADRRGTTPAKFQATMGEGRVFLGRSALKVGLIDGVMSFEDVMTHAKKLDKVNAANQNSRNLNKDASMKATLASALLLSLIGGAGVEGLDLKVAAATAEGVEPDADAQAALMVQAQEVATAVTTATKAAAEAAVAPVQAQLTDAQAALATAASDLALAKSGATQLTTELTAAKALNDQRDEIVKASISTMSVALNGPKDAGKDLSGEALLAEHARLAEQFKAKFPAGGVAAVGAAESATKKEVVTVDPVMQHLLNRTRPQTSRTNA